MQNYRYYFLYMKVFHILQLMDSYFPHFFPFHIGDFTHIPRWKKSFLFSTSAVEKTVERLSLLQKETDRLLHSLHILYCYYCLLLIIDMILYSAKQTIQIKNKKISTERVVHNEIYLQTIRS